MNIGILIPGFGANEADWALPVYQNLVRELAKSHDVRVIALRYPHTQESYAYHNAQVYPLGYGAWTRGIRRLSLWWATWRMVKRLHDEKPFDVLHGIWADETGALSGWISNRLNIQSVVTVAGGELVGLPDIRYGLQLSFYSRWIVQRALYTNDAIILPSKMGGIPDAQQWIERMHYIPLGIDPDLFYPSKIERKPKHLIHIGSLIPVKNQMLLLDILPFLDEDVTLDIIGEGHFEDGLKSYATMLGIDHRVQFLGKVPHTNLRQHYSSAQLHVITSHHEAFGMSILEAAACGTPTVGTLVGLISDEFDITRFGHTVDELAEQIELLLNSKAKLSSIRKKSARLIQKKYTIQRIADDHIKLYQSLAES